MKYLPFILYTIGSLMFVAGSVVSMWQIRQAEQAAHSHHEGPQPSKENSQA